MSQTTVRFAATSARLSRVNLSSTNHQCSSASYLIDRRVYQVISHYSPSLYHE